MLYGLTESDIEKIDEKIKRGLLYQDETGYKSYNANINPDLYFAELNNRINAIKVMAKKAGLKPIFLTITLPSSFHPSSKHYKDKTIKEGISFLSGVWRKIITMRIYRRSSKEKYYIRAIEPHKSGVPHSHIVLYLPEENHDRFKKAFVRLMERNNIKQYDFKNNFSNDKYNNDTGVIAYILKYILKGFRKPGEKMELIHYWYIKHRVQRVTMSRSTLPLYVYRKINYRFFSIYKASLLFKNNQLQINQNRTEVFKLVYDETLDLVHFDTIWYKSNQKKEKTFDKNKVLKNIRLSKMSPFVPVEFVNSEGKKSYTRYNLVSGRVVQKVVIPAYMKDYQLLTYFHSLNPEDESISLLHYGITQNECVRRGLIQGKTESLNDFNLDL